MCLDFLLPLHYVAVFNISFHIFSMSYYVSFIYLARTCMSKLITIDAIGFFLKQKLVVRFGFFRKFLDSSVECGSSLDENEVC